MSKKPPKQTKLFNNHLRKAVIIASFVALLAFVAFLTIWITLLDKIYPKIYIANISVGFLTKDEAKQKIDLSLSQKLAAPLIFKYTPGTSSASRQLFKISLDENTQTIQIDRSLDKAFEFGHNKPYLSKQNLSLSISFTQKLDSEIYKIAQAVNIPPVDSNLSIDGEEIIATPSQNGLNLDQEKLKQQLADYINTGDLDDTLPVKITPPKLSYDQAIEIKKRLDQIKLTPLKLVFQDQTFTLDLNQILTLIDLENTESSLFSTTLFDKKINIKSFGVADKEYLDTKLTLNKDKLASYLKNIKSQIDRPVQEPLFNLENTSDPNKPKIKEFRAPEEGKALNIELASQKISQALITQNQTTVELPVTVIQPKNRLTNELGIKELIGRGVSNFAGSIQNRIYNLSLAASRINGVLIPPGEEFSFVNTVGDITSTTGYKQAYVIKSGRTVLDDGGGVCQVSTTVFRAALNSGLPITARTAHAYRVGYYEQGYPPGLDATIYYPSVDFKFKNDTGRHILIQSYTDGLNLYVDLFGTSDGRVATLTRPVVTNITPAPAPLYQDDPTLPAGTVKQVDFAAAGANVIFSRTVERGGQTIIKDSFRSNFRPWQAVFLRGTKTS